MSIFRVLTSYQKIQKALQWWSYRQSMKLFIEAEKIRDELLQESFTIRRNLDLLSIDNLNLTNAKLQEHLKQIDSLHHSLVKLSDRLFPATLQASLPLAIECLLDSWLASHPHLYFEIDMPVRWRHEPAERGLIILMSLEELLTISLSQILTPLSIYISLKQQKHLGQLNVQITYSDVSTIVFPSKILEFDHLCHSFILLTSGKCFYHTTNFGVAWHFCW